MDWILIFIPARTALLFFHDSMTTQGASAAFARRVNGIYDRVPSKRGPGEAPSYQRRDVVGGGGAKTSRGSAWLLLAFDNAWIIGESYCP